MLGKKISQIGIERKQVRLSEKREWVYILNRSKIANKLRETIGNIEEFSNTPQDNPPINNSMDIQSIFNVPEIVSPQSEKETSENIVESAKIIEASDNHSSLEIESSYEISCSAKEIESSNNITCASENILSVNDVSQPRKACNEENTPNRYRYLQDTYPVRSGKNVSDNGPSIMVRTPINL